MYWQWHSQQRRILSVYIFYTTYAIKPIIIFIAYHTNLMFSSEPVRELRRRKNEEKQWFVDLLSFSNHSINNQSPCSLTHTVENILYMMGMMCRLWFEHYTHLQYYLCNFMNMLYLKKEENIVSQWHGYFQRAIKEEAVTFSWQLLLSHGFYSGLNLEQNM